ncbi:MAG: stage 0 sporulation family protein [Dehalococcoidia bacterium]
MVDQQRVPVGIRFKEAGKIYYFDARGFELDVGNYVVVETSHGQEIGRVVIAPDQVIVSEIKETLKPIQRIAEPEDLQRTADLKKRAVEQVPLARRKVGEEGLEMHVVAGDYNLDGSQLTLYYTAEDRVDFRDVARDLSTEFETRVQLLQVGDRDRAKIVDGIGRCGERLCCSSWLSTFPTVSIRHAKEQDLPLNPSKLSGACGRLLCCLTYEYDQYREIKGTLPKVGSRISTPSGDAKVLSINVPKETISLFMQDATERVEMPLDQFRLMYGTAVRPKQLTETFEKQLMAEGSAEAPAPARPPRPPSQRPARRPPPRPRQGQRPPAAAEQPRPEAQPRPDTQPAGDQPGAKRRRRRGGRRRHRGGGGGGGGGGGSQSQG